MMSRTSWKGLKSYETLLGEEGAEQLEYIKSQYPQYDGRSIIRLCVQDMWYRVKAKKTVKFGSCGKCGAPVVVGDKYCAECGEKLNWSGNE